MGSALARDGSWLCAETVAQPQRGRTVGKDALPILALAIKTILSVDCRSERFPRSYD